MRAVLRLELIGEPYHWLRLHRHEATVQRPLPLREEINIIRYGNKRLRPWVARIIGFDDTYKYKREFMEGIRDWRFATWNGKRGVYEYYALPDGLYEVNECIELGKARRYFVKVKNRDIEEISEETVIACLKTNDTSA